jgi:hypothetical protein
MPDLEVFTIDPIDGEAVAALAQEFLVSIRFVDSDDHSLVLADYTGSSAVKASHLFTLLPAAVLERIVRENAPDLLWTVDALRSRLERPGPEPTTPPRAD